MDTTSQVRQSSVLDCKSWRCSKTQPVKNQSDWTSLRFHSNSHLATRMLVDELANIVEHATNLELFCHLQSRIRSLSGSTRRARTDNEIVTRTTPVNARTSKMHVR